MKARSVQNVVLCVVLSATAARAQEPSPEQPPPVPGGLQNVPAQSPEPLGEPNPSSSPAQLGEPGGQPPLESLEGMDLQMTPEELASLGINVDKPKLDLSVRLFGFADVGFGFQFGPQDSPNRATGAAPAYSTFFAGNLNVYLGKQITETISMLSEVRLSYLPNGSNAFGLQERVDTTAYDYTDFGRPTRWGGIILQRLYIDWTPHQLITFRMGQFLTPYGVWNVDHGSPVVIPVRRPWSIGVGWIPEKQTGIEVLGRASLGQHSFGYHLTLSNGTGPVSEYRDLDENKAVGGRLYWEYRRYGLLRLGGSFYYGRDTDAERRWVRNANGEQRSTEVINSQFDALSWAADLTWEFKGLHVQTEWLTNQRAYTEKGRAQQQTLSGLTIIPVDAFSWGGYGLIGYRLPWLGIMPFLMVERVKGDLLNLALKFYNLSPGLNIRPTESVVIKLTYQYVHFEGEGYMPLQEVMTQIAWAF